MVLTMKTPAAAAAATSAFIVASHNIKNFIKFIKMQQFMAIMIIMVIIKADLISAKTTDVEALEKQLMDIRNKCIQNTFLTKEQSKMILSNKALKKDSDWANTPKNIQCYFYCYLEEFGLFKNGKPNEKVLRENLSLLINDKKKSDSVMDKCLKFEGKDKCEIGFSFVLCVFKETELHLF